MTDSPLDEQLELADNFYREENYDKAFKHYEKALSFFPFHEYCMTQLARVLYMKSTILKLKNNPSTVEKILKRANNYSNKAIKKYPKNPDALFVKAWICFDLEDYTTALRFLEKTLKIIPNYNQAIEKKAECLNSLEKYEKAIECYDLLLKNDPENMGMLYSKGLGYSLIGDDKKAIDIFEIIKKRDHLEDNMKYAYILSLNKLERYDESIEIGNELINDSKFRNVTICAKVRSLTGLDKFEEAIKLADSVKPWDSTMHPGENDFILNALFDKGRCLERLKKFEDSKKAFHEVVKNCKYEEELYVKNDALERLGHIHWINGEYKNAKKYFFQITKSDIEKNVPILDLKNEAQNQLPFLISRNMPLEKLLQEEESVTLEFKSTLIHPMQDRPENNPSISDRENEENVIKSSLKTICAFLNSKGGTLLIGISDSKEIVGIENDIKFHLRKKTWDSWNQQLNNYIRDRIGTEFTPYITVNKEEKNGKTIAIITVKPCSRPAFLDPNNKLTCAFFTRTSHGTIHCDVKTAVTIISNTERFNIFKNPEKKD